MSDTAFLRAIASDPADDTARLVFADFLEESGDPVQVARAEFIRTQIQASTLHPNDPRRGELDARADELFAAHWVGWWAPVCDGVGLRGPYVPTGRLRERIGRFFGRKPPRVGYPYKVESGTAVAPIPRRPPSERPPNTLRQVAFQRGFPQRVSLLGQLNDVRHVVHAWTNIAPLAGLALNGAVARDWQQIEGEHLHGLRELTLANAATTAVVAAGASRHVPRVEDVTLRPDRSNAHWPEEQYRAFAASPLAARTKWLRVTLGTVAEANALDGPHLANLRGLHIEGVGEFVASTHAMAELLASPHLTGLRELTLIGREIVGIRVIPSRVASGLRRLSVFGVSDGISRVFVEDHFSNITDLTLSVFRSAAVIADLADSPLAPRLQHLRLVSGSSDPNLRALVLDLAAALDPERLETLALDPTLAAIAGDELRERFPGRVSVI